MHNKQTSQALEELDADANQKGFAVERSPRGVFLVPKKPSGQLMSQEEFESEDPNVKQKIEEQGNELQAKLCRRDAQGPRCGEGTLGAAART